MSKKSSTFVPFMGRENTHMEVVEGLQKRLDHLAEGFEHDQVVMLMDDKVDLQVDYPTLRISVNEAHKSLSSITKIWDFLFANGLTRHGLLICVGGGVLLDMGGFAASTYKRGIAYVNVPTTLLAMVDAAIGGKTGFNYGGLKNSIGTFAQPLATINDVTLLGTLPPRQFLSGYGEILKMGLLDADLWYDALRFDLDQIDEPSLLSLVNKCSLSKQRVVDSDPMEKGERKVLNLGHTFGHALEELSLKNDTPSSLLHGYAVVYGLIAELYLSVVLLGCPKQPLEQLTQIMLHYYGKPVCKCSDRERLVALMQQDKKSEHVGQINCTLLRNVGCPVVNQSVTEEMAKEALDYLFSL